MAALVFLCALNVMAQAPTSLSYPSPNAFVLRYSVVNLSPTVAGNVASYSVNPALPAGLSIDANTGVISGRATDTSTAPINYTITATNPSGSTSKTISIQITNNVFNNAGGQLSFLSSNATFPNGGTGITNGSIVLYSNVVTLSGTQIDCIITTRSVVNATFDAYDQNAVSGTYFNNNTPNFFSPQLNLSAAGSVTYDFQFILGGTYNSTTKTGTNVTLQNVKLNTYDIDGNSTYAQYNEFGGFSSSEISNVTGTNASRIVSTYTPATGLTRFTSNNVENLTDVTDARSRIRVNFDNMSGFSIVVGAAGNGLAYFILDFSTGFAGFTTNTTAAPSLDLNRTLAGVNNSATGCASIMPFVPSGETNIIIPTTGALTNLTVSLPTTDVRNAGSESLIFNGATAGGSMLLDAADGTSTVTLNSTVYTVVRATAGGRRTFTFTATALTVALAEQLLDAMHYQNAASAPITGDRNFTVNILASAFKSPDAIFTTNSNCVSISGNIWHDANGQSDGTVNSNGSPSFAANALYAMLTDPADNNRVLARTGISAAGAYSFGTVVAKTYNILFTTSATLPAVGTTGVVASVYPVSTGGVTYKSTAENLGATAGSDGLADGILRITVGSESVANANFGIEISPTTAATTRSNIPNPGGFNGYPFVAADFTTADADGSVAGIVINTFPMGANYLKVGAMIYTNGGTCPPQSTCTPFPATGGVTVAITDVSTVSVDPTMAGATTVVVNYSAIDNAGVTGDASNATLNFTGAAGTDYLTISGNVWNDANGDGVKGATENLINPANSGEQLYAVLIQTSKTYSGVNTVFAAVPVDATTGYTFTNTVPANTNYEVRIISATAGTAPANGTAASLMTQVVPATWLGVTTSKNPTSPTIATGLNTTTPAIIVVLTNANATAQNFGIEQIPTADAKAFTVINAAFTPAPSVVIGGKQSYAINGNSTSLTGSAIKSLSGTDPEDCAAASSCTTGKTYVIAAQKTNTIIYYNFTGTSVPVVFTGAGTNNVITNFDPAKLTVYGQQGSGNAVNPLGFTYSIRDNAGVLSPAVNYTITSISAPLPVTVLGLTAMRAGGVNNLIWASAEEAAISTYDIERSDDGHNFAVVGTVAAKGNNSTYVFADAIAMNTALYYRLGIAGANGNNAYSNIVSVTSGTPKGQITLFPIPASSMVVISGITAPAQLTVTDLSGRVVMTVAQVQNNQTIDIASLASGTYLVHAIGAGEQQFLKLIVAH